MPAAKAVDTNEVGVEELGFLVLPKQTILFLSSEAAKRNLSLAQLIATAVEAYLVQTGNTAKE